MDYLTLKWLHVLSSTFLFGTGVGSAFYLLFASLSRDARTAATVAGLVVVADFLFTATTVVIQPVTGFYLAHRLGLPLGSRWLVWSIALYVVAIACWLPVVAIQIRLRDIAREAAERQAALPASYWRHLRLWVLLGIPAFFAFVAIFYLMIRRPV